MSKTQIFTAEEAKYHFQIEENQYIDKIEKVIREYESGADFKAKDRNEYRKVEKELHKKFKNHLTKNTSAKYYEKITKRYITTFGKLGSTKLISQIVEMYKIYPGIRNNLMTYLSIIGYSKDAGIKISTILKEIKLYDDISLFTICRLLTSWKIPTNEHGREVIEKCEHEIDLFSKLRKNPFDFYCLLWFKTKYSHPIELYDFIKAKDYIWMSSPFLRRQVISVLGRIYSQRKTEVEAILDSQISTSESQVVSVATSIKKFSNLDKIEPKVRFYLFPDSEYQRKTYPLSKFVVLCSFLNSEKYRSDRGIVESVKEYISDPYYRKWIEMQYAIG